MENLTIITGASSGLGKQLAESMNPTTTVGIGRYFGESVWFKQVVFDIRDYENYGTYISEKEQKINLVLCAGVLGKSGGLLDSSLSDWENTMKTNLFGNIALIKAFLPAMIKNKYGRIVFVAGGGAAYGYPLFSGYALSKVAIVRAVENLSLEMKDKIKNFSIIALAPGAMETRMLEEVRKAGAEIKTTVDIQETASFIKNFLSMKSKEANKLSGKFIHIRDNLESEDFKDKWLLRRIE